MYIQDLSAQNEHKRDKECGVSVDLIWIFSLLESVHVMEVSGSPALLCSGFSRPCWMSNMVFLYIMIFSFWGVGAQGWNLKPNY